MIEGRKGTCSLCGAPSTYYGKTTQYCISDAKAWKEENAKLKKIIAKCPNENDDLGAEYTHVVILKEENEKLKAAYDEAKQDIQELIGALENSREGHAQIIRNSNDVLAKKNSTFFMSKDDEVLSKIKPRYEK